MNTSLILAAVVAALLAGVAVGFGKTSPRSIALWQIAGGAMIIVAWGVALTQSTPRPNVLTFISSLALAFLAMVAGLLLWRGSLVGTRLSLLAQALQVAWISLPMVQFGSTLGPTLGVRLTSTSLTFNMGFYGRGGFAIASEARFPVDITVNLLAIVAFLALVRTARTRSRLLRPN